eukprot:11423578-Ditylum_brightwellii.AAC.1
MRLKMVLPMERQQDRFRRKFGECVCTHRMPRQKNTRQHHQNSVAGTKSHLDAADLLLELLVTQGTMSLADATTIWEMNQQSEVIQNEVEDGSANFLAGSLVNEIFMCRRINMHI